MPDGRGGRVTCAADWKRCCMRQSFVESFLSYVSTLLDIAQVRAKHQSAKNFLAHLTILCSYFGPKSYEYLCAAKQAGYLVILYLDELSWKACCEYCNKITRHAFQPILQCFRLHKAQTQLMYIVYSLRFISQGLTFGLLVTYFKPSSATPKGVSAITSEMFGVANCNVTYLTLCSSWNIWQLIHVSVR